MSGHNELGKQEKASTRPQKRVPFPGSEYWVSHERLEDWVSFLIAKDLEAKAILEGKTWNSPEVQNVFDQLRREISGTEKWAKQCAEVLKAYQVKLAEDEPNITQSDIIARSGTLADMLERLWVEPH